MLYSLHTPSPLPFPPLLHQQARRSEEFHSAINISGENFDATSRSEGEGTLSMSDASY